jgi:hypothetical protein
MVCVYPEFGSQMKTIRNFQIIEETDRQFVGATPVLAQHTS